MAVDKVIDKHLRLSLQLQLSLLPLPSRHSCIQSECFWPSIRLPVVFCAPVNLSACPCIYVITLSNYTR